MADGKHVLALASSQDHKRLSDGDRGPNTGGMGAYSPAPVVTPEVHARIMREIILPAVNGMAADGIPYTGFLYAGVMIDAAGNPSTLEFNCRLGDPETQPIMMRLKSDLVDLLEHGVNGTLDQIDAEWDRRVALGVVLAAAGYPDDPRRGDVISGLDQAQRRVQGVSRRHVGRRRQGRDQRRAACFASPRWATPCGTRSAMPTRRSPAFISTACSIAPTSATARWRRAAANWTRRLHCHDGHRERRRILDRTAGSHRRPAGGDRRHDVPARCLAAAGRRRRHQPDHRARPRLRARRRQLLARPRRAPAAVGERRAAAARRPRVRGDGHFAGAASGQSACADRAHEPAPVRREKGRRRCDLVVRRRHGPDALLRLRRGRRAFPPLLPRCAGAVRRRLLSALQALVRRILPAPASQRAARRRRNLFRRLERSGLRPQLCADSQRRRWLPRRLRADPAAAQGSAVRRARARIPDLSPRPLRRVQPRLRSRHAVRTAVERPHRGDPDVAAAGRQLALRLAPRAGERRGEALYRLSGRSRLAGRGAR